MNVLKSGLAILALSFLAQTAHADLYVGALGGYGIPAGDAAADTSGLALGATAGIQLMPNLGIGATYIHDAMKIGSYDMSETQYLLEANFFSLLFFPSGVHFGSIHNSITNSSDFGVGLHTGFDIPLVANFTIGLAAYWTYVTQDNNKHSLVNILIPVKFHL